MTDIKIKRGIGKPDSLVEGELAIDTDTGALYSLVAGVVTELNAPPEGVDLSNYIDSTKRNDVVEGTFQILWDDSADETYPFNGRIGYNRNSEDPNSLDGSFLYASGTRGTFSIGRDGDVELHGPSEIQGIPDRDDKRPWITGFSYVQAADFLDADGNSIVGGGGDYVNADEEKFKIQVGTLPIYGSKAVSLGMEDGGGYVSDYSVGVGFNAKAGYYGTTVGAMSEARDFSVAIGRSANVWAKNAVAIGYGTWAREDHSVAIGSQAETEEPGQVMFGTPPNHPQDGQVLNLKTYGTMQAADYLDADGNSIVGGSDDYVIADEENFNIQVGTIPGGASNSVAIGMRGNNLGYAREDSVAVGFDAKAAGKDAVVVGGMSEAREFSVAVGRSSNVWASKATAIGYGTWARHDQSVAIGSQAETEEPGQVMFGTPPNHPYGGKSLNLKTYGTMQAADFLDADGNSIIGQGGGDSIKAEWLGEDGKSPIWWLNYLQDVPTPWTYRINPVEDPNNENNKAGFVSNGTSYLDKINTSEVKAVRIVTMASHYEGNSPDENCVQTGTVYGLTNHALESRVYGGINILGADKERPDELPYSPEEKSIQYALTVTHETLGRTVEIDKEGIIRAREFTDMDGNPIGGGGGMAIPNEYEYQFNLVVGTIKDDALNRGDNHTILGDDVNVDRSNSVAVGWRVTSLGDSTAVGVEALASLYSASLGNNARANAVNALALGYNAQTDNSDSIALGHNALTTAANQFAISPSITEVDFSNATVQATDFLDADGNRFVPASINTGSAGVAIGSAYGFGGSTYYLYPTTSSGTHDEKGCLGDANARWSVVHAETYYKGGSPLIAAEDLIEAFTALQSAISDEDDPAAMKEALVNSLGGLIEQFEGYERADP